MQQLRLLDLKKVPSVSETIDWARVLVLLHAASLDAEQVRDTLNVLLKFEADIEVANKQIARELVVAPETAKKHVSHILGKLGAVNRTQAVARARELGLLR